MKKAYSKKTTQLAIGSLISSIAGFFCLYLFFGFLGLLNPVYKLFGILSISFYILSFILVILTFILAAANRGNLKASIFATIATAIMVYSLLSWPVFNTTLARAHEATVSYNLRQLYQAIWQYTETNDGYLPTADEWCDLLMEHDEKLTKDAFKCPHGKYGVYTFVFNENLDGFRLDDIANDTALLFEVEKGWNHSGGAELIEPFYKEEKRFFVLRADGRCYRSDPVLRELFDEKLRWKP